MSFGSADEVVAGMREMVRAPRRIPVSKAAENHIRVEMRGGAAPWSREVAPYLVEPMDCTASRLYEAVIFAGPARTGKTQGLVNGLLTHAVMCDPMGDMLAVFPTEQNAHRYGRTDLRKLHQYSPELKAKLSPRAHDTAITSIIYRNGMAIFLGHPTTGQLAQTTYRRVVFSDYDSITSSVGDEGEAFWIGAKRNETFLSGGIAVAESSPKRYQTDPRWRPKTPHEAPPVDGGILSLYNMGDRRRWKWTCRHCGELFEAPALPSFDDLPKISDAAQSANVPCPHCGGIHLPHDKRELNLSGRWVAEPGQEGNTIASFWMLGCAAAFQTWGGLVSAFLRAQRQYDETGDEESLKKSYNTDQGLPYLPKAIANCRSSGVLIERAEEFERAVVPRGVRFLFTAIDVQTRRFVVQVLGFGVDRECWIVDRYDILWSKRETANGEREPINPAAQIEDWNLLDSVVMARYPLDGEPDAFMRIHLTLCDSGGEPGVTMRAGDWWRGLKSRGLHRNVLLVKGASHKSEKSPIVEIGYPDSSKRKDRKSGMKGDVPVLFLQTDRIKDGLDADLKRDESGPGFVHLPKWAPDSFFDELVAEVRTPSGWQPIKHGIRNESWDLICYPRAAWYHLKCDRINWASPPGWAREWNSNTGIERARPLPPVEPENKLFIPE